MCICCLLGALALTSTAIDFAYVKDKKPLTKAETVMTAFSLYSNGKKLFNTAPGGKDEMSAINGIKFLSMFWVLLGHKYMYLSQSASVNLTVILNFFGERAKMFIVNGTMSVDTFFVMSGLLNAYGFFVLVNRKKSYGIFDILISYLHRFIRLSPPFFLMVGLTASVLYRLGDGPMWNRVILPARDFCQQYWWYDLLYITDYHDYCLDQSWYLGSDMQMFWASPILFYPMWRWPAFGIVWYFITLLGAISVPFAVSYYYKITVPVPVLPSQSSPDVVNPSAIIYLPVHVRLSTYIIGIMAGYLLYKIRKGELNFKPSRLVAFVGWLVAGVCLLYPIYGGYEFYHPSHQISQVGDSLFIALFRPMWGLGVAWVIIACVTGYGGVINTILSLGIFRPLGRLSYCTYLTHIAVIKTGYALARTAGHIDDYRLIQEVFGDLFFSLCAAAALSLLVESPTMILEKIMLGNLRPPTRREEAPPAPEITVTVPVERE